ncbi:protein transport protein SEC31 [Babesia microti strain RI]|uniref:Protein transport protein SEC31 n=1 Tax=Babesia microti (strain RI) TaxID=1133968 RepID=A0A0K3AS64_BABMR|nr:protein transport protein SEC31 [Babesia microti strain RI]CTQ41443.1 protein transport protein SEC31 [Babesia microti strain RI]|eukprot:XP_012649454.1 protein transport protein SEC31 [Babesia microti strain RI]
MSLNFLDKGVGTLVTNKDGNPAAFIVKKPIDSPTNLTASLVDLDLGAVDNLSDVFKTRKNITIDVINDQATLVKWNCNAKNSVAAIGLSSGSFSLINPYASMSPNHVVTGARSSISGLEFSFHDPTIASISQGGLLCLTDISSTNVTKLSDEVSSSGFNSTVTWNHRVGHILATNNPGGNANIWDIKLKKTATSFGNNTNFSSVQWIPEQATQLITSSNDNPIIQLWDLRNTGAPLKEFCTPCLVKNLAFSPHNHSIFTTTGVSTDSNDQLMLWSIELELQNSILFECEPSISFAQSYVSWSMYNPALVLWNSSDSMSLTNIYNQAQVTNIPHLNKLKYGIATGFASRIATYGGNSNSVTGYKAICEQVKMDMSIIESDLTACKMICESKARDKSVSDELDRTSWLVTSALFSSNRKDMLSAIGLDVDNVIVTAKKLLGETVEPNELKQEKDDPEEFFRELGQRSDTSSSNDDKKTTFVYEGDKLPDDMAKALDDCISIGDLGIAADLCLLAGRTTEALLLAHGAGIDEWNRISKAIVSHSKDPLITKIAILTSGDLYTLVSNADLKEWKLILASICTFADNDNFFSYCGILAERLLTSEIEGAIKAAIVCYQVAGNVNGAFDNWYDFPEPIDTKVLRMAMFQKASRCSPSGSSLNKFVSLVSKMSEKLAQSGYITEALGLLSIIQPQHMVEMQVYKISQLHGGAMGNPPYSLIPIYFSHSGASSASKSTMSGFQSIPGAKPNFTVPGPSIKGPAMDYKPTIHPSTPAGPVVNTTHIKTTAPTAVAEAMYPGMPVPWPIPTPTQQLVSETNVTIDANMKIAAKSAATAVPAGEPMSASNYSLVNSAIKGLMANALVNESSSKKAQEIQLRIDQLFDAIKSCKLSAETNNQLIELCKAVEASDFINANKILMSISSTAWDSNNKGWIMVLKRIVPR